MARHPTVTKNEKKDVTRLLVYKSTRIFKGMRLESLLINCPTFKTSYLPKTEQELPVIQGQFHSLDSQSLQQMPGELCQLPVH